MSCYNRIIEIFPWHFCDTKWEILRHIVTYNRERLATIFKYHRGHETILIRMLLLFCIIVICIVSRHQYSIANLPLLRIQSIFFKLNPEEDPGISCFETHCEIEQSTWLCFKIVNNRSHYPNYFLYSMWTLSKWCLSIKYSQY